MSSMHRKLSLSFICVFSLISLMASVQVQSNPDKPMSTGMVWVESAGGCGGGGAAGLGGVGAAAAAGAAGAAAAEGMAKADKKCSRRE